MRRFPVATKYRYEIAVAGFAMLLALSAVSTPLFIDDVSLVEDTAESPIRYHGAPNEMTSQYRPVAAAILATERAANTPVSYRRGLRALLAALAAALVYRVVRRATSPDDARWGVPASLALLPVAWTPLFLSAIGDQVGTLATLVAMRAAQDGPREPARRATIALLLALAVFSKESFLVAPLLVALCVRATPAAVPFARAEWALYAAPVLLRLAVWSTHEGASYGSARGIDPIASLRAFLLSLGLLARASVPGGGSILRVALADSISFEEVLGACLLAVLFAAAAAVRRARAPIALALLPLLPWLGARALSADPPYAYAYWNWYPSVAGWALLFSLRPAAGPARLFAPALLALQLASFSYALPVLRSEERFLRWRVEEDPLDPGPLLDQARFDEARGDRAAAARGYRAVLERDATFSIAHNNYAVLLLARGDTASAEKHLQAAVAHAERTDPRVRYALRLAVLLRREGRTAEALAALDPFLREDFPDPILWNEAGILRALSGDREGAEDAFVRSLRLRPEGNPAAGNLRRLNRLAPIRER